jgi:Transglutaminase-like superfamily
MSRYALAEHVFVCVNGEHLVLLDVKEDRYWALEAARTRGLGTLVGGWPVSGGSSATSEDPPAAETSAVLDVLRGRGMLEETAPPGKDATPVKAQVPFAELLTESESAPGPPVRSWAGFAAASVFARLALRIWPFERVIRRVRGRKALWAAQAPPFDQLHARKLVEAFGRYRVFLFSSRDECLYDSLALLEFLARRRVYPDWVFGVQTRPFAAHCWVQHGGIVFNDTVEHVSGFTPIMVV